MKKLLVAAAILLTVVGAKAQGTLDFGTQTNPVFDTDGTTKLSGSSYVAQLYWAPVGTTTYTAVSGSPGPFLTGGGAGFWDSGADGARSVAGQPGGTTVLVVARAWTAASGSFAAAQTAAGGKYGQSPALTIVLGGGGVPAALPADLSAMASFKLTAAPVNTPEPSTIALGLLGAGALLLRRKK